MIYIYHLLRVLKTITTNLIHVIGFVLSTFLTVPLLEHWSLDWKGELKMALGLTYSILFMYGWIYMLGFLVVMMLMDIAAFSWRNRWVKESLIMQWVIVSAPLIYAAFEYKFWLWLSLSLALLITQMMRKRWIVAINRAR